MLRNESHIASALASKDRAATRTVLSLLRDESEAKRSAGVRIVVRAFASRLRAFVSPIVGGDPEIADEVVNETFLRIALRIGGFDPTRAAFRTWVYQQAKYAAQE